jgi:hypothetical protein
MPRLFRLTRSCGSVVHPCNMFSVLRSAAADLRTDRWFMNRSGSERSTLNFQHPMLNLRKNFSQSPGAWEQAAPVNGTYRRATFFFVPFPRLLPCGRRQTPSIRPVRMKSANILDLAVVIACFIFMLGIGVYFMRLNKGGKQYFTCGSMIPWWMSGMTLYMANFSAYTFTDGRLDEVGAFADDGSGITDSLHRIVDSLQHFPRVGPVLPFHSASGVER